MEQSPTDNAGPAEFGRRRALGLLGAMGGGTAALMGLRAPVPAATPLRLQTSAVGPSPYPFTVTNLDQAVPPVTAPIFPEKFTVTKKVAWTKSPTGSGDAPELVFKSGEGRTVEFTLVFDTTASGADAHALYVQKLTAFAMIMDPNGPEDKRRPPRVAIRWEPDPASRIDGVISRIETTYTAYSLSGIPTLASCEVVLLETSRATFSRV